MVSTIIDDWRLKNRTRSGDQNESQDSVFYRCNRKILFWEKSMNYCLENRGIPVPDVDRINSFIIVVHPFRSLS